jgi:hypothetical protein
VVNLSSTTENLNIEWFNPETGKRISGGTIAGGNTRLFKVPFTGDAVLYVYDTKLQQSQSANIRGISYFRHNSTILSHRDTCFTSNDFCNQSCAIYTFIYFRILYHLSNGVNHLCSIRKKTDIFPVPA